MARPGASDNPPDVSGTQSLPSVPAAAGAARCPAVPGAAEGAPDPGSARDTTGRQPVGGRGLAGRAPLTKTDAPRRAAPVESESATGLDRDEDELSVD